MNAFHSIASLMSLLADIPPPPPEIPILDTTLPQPVVVVVAGLCLSFAALLVGVRWKRGKHPSLGWFALCIGVVVAFVTLAAGTWAGNQWKAHKERLENWVPNGPVEDWNREINDQEIDSSTAISPLDADDPDIETTSE